MPSGIYKRKPTTPLCHPDRPRHGWGMCSPCYEVWYKKTHPDYAEKQKAYRKKRRLLFGPKINNMTSGQNYRKWRKLALEKLGNKCCKCGFDNPKALQIDHINGGGIKEIRGHTYKGIYSKHVINSVANNENKYQLLCANCNWIKKVDNNE